jgi:exonuclease SbcD
MHAGSNAYVEVVYQGNEVVADLSEQLEAQVLGSDLRLLRVYNRQFVNKVLVSAHDEATLPDLNPTEVFEACMAQHELDEAQKANCETVTNWCCTKSSNLRRTKHENPQLAL